MVDGAERRRAMHRRVHTNAATFGLMMLLALQAVVACRRDEPASTDTSAEVDAATACAPADAGCDASSPPHDRGPYARWPDSLSLLPRGRTQTDRVCQSAADDLVRDVFCEGDRGASIASLSDLQLALGINPQDIPGGLFGVSITAHSTALSARSVSAINPRMILMRIEAGAFELLILAFVRGEQSVELVTRDRQSGELTFYVVGFRQACNERAEGCHFGDLLTPAIEQGWTELALYDEATLRPTVMDCAPCHQPDGPGTPKLLRMQEFERPWTHWFFMGTEGGDALLQDYFAARGDEPLGSLSWSQIRGANPASLQIAVSFASPVQPQIFPSPEVEGEVMESAAGQPADNSTPGTSATWRALYGQSQRGEGITVPYHDVKVTDADKLARMTVAYRAYREGRLSPEALPDIRDVYPDDPRLLANMGVMTAPDQAGREVLMEACSLCHNERLDQTLPRARFRADLVGMDRAARDRAVARLMLDEGDPGAMPPARLRRLSADARARAIEALQEE